MSAISSPAPDEGPIQASLLPDNTEVLPGLPLQIGAVDLLELAAKYGTPLFVYDEDHLRARCREARESFDEGVAYATKAFLCRAMARIAFEEGLFLDVSTGGELHVALAAGVDPGSIVLHGSNKDTAELERAMEVGIGRIVIDSFDEIDRLEALARDLHSRIGVLIRATPGIEAHTHEYVRTGQQDSKFGFSVATGAASAAIERLRSIANVDLLGVHAHIGSQIFLATSFIEEVEVLAGMLVPLELEELCIGGGLGVPYVAGESAPSISEWATTVRDTARLAGVPESVRLTAEPGRAIAASAAITLYTVGTIKELPGIRTYVSVDGGMSDNPRPVLYGSGYEAFLPRSPQASRPRAVTIVGKHCETGDVVVADARVPADLHLGDILATPVTGAYGYSMASNYNKVPRPAVVFVRQGEVRVVVRRESLDDLLSHDEA
ncbi:MAG: diaminopimelate decarboxylase [Acidimicrobiales bacterium]